MRLALLYVYILATQTKHTSEYTHTSHIFFFIFSFLLFFAVFVLHSSSRTTKQSLFHLHIFSHQNDASSHIITSAIESYTLRASEPHNLSCLTQINFAKREFASLIFLYVNASVFSSACILHHRERIAASRSTSSSQRSQQQHF